MDSLLIMAIHEAAGTVGIDPLLVRALIHVESGGNPWAFNPEPAYRYLWDVQKRKPFRPLGPAEAAVKRPPADFRSLAGDPDQEWWGQQTSWGLMQVMGAVARERGFRGPYLTQLCAPKMNLTYGCGHLAALLTWAKADAEQALAGYNGGRGGNAVRPFRNSRYAFQVLTVKTMLSNPNLSGERR